MSQGAINSNTVVDTSDQGIHSTEEGILPGYVIMGDSGSSCKVSARLEDGGYD